jgi:alpha-beta hydrolase superfamily lysophospholipase
MGHSMGCMPIDTYLHLNPEIAGRLAGVIYSAPFFGMIQKKTAGEKWLISQMASVMDEIVLIGGL